jgi:hypothetical protein
VSARTRCRVRADTIFTARTRFLLRPRVKPCPQVNADAGGRLDGHFHPKTSIMTSLAGTDPGKEELQLRAAQCTTGRIGDPKVLNVAMAKLLGAELVRLTWLARRCSAPKSGKPMFLLVLKASYTSRTRLTSPIYGFRPGQVVLNMLVAVYPT